MSIRMWGRQNQALAGAQGGTAATGQRPDRAPGTAHHEATPVGTGRRRGTQCLANDGRARRPQRHDPRHCGTAGPGRLRRPVQALRPRLKTFLMRSGLSATAAEEIAQETMLSVWRKAGYFDPAKGRRGDLDLHHRPESQDRRPAPRAPVAQLPTEAEDTRTRPPMGKPSCWRRSGRTRCAPPSPVSRPTRPIRSPVLLSGQAPRQIAKELGIPHGTAKSRVRLALARLRALLEDIG